MSAEQDARQIAAEVGLAAPHEMAAYVAAVALQQADILALQQADILAGIREMRDVMSEHAAQLRALHAWAGR